MKLTPISLAIICTISLFACKKESDDDTLPAGSSTTVDSTMKFVIEQPTARVLYFPKGLEIPLEVLYIDGKKEEVYLKAGYFPSDVKTTFTPDKGIPPFSTVLTVSPSHYFGGVKEVSIAGTSKSGIKKEYPFTIDFHGQATVAADMAGVYTNVQYTGNDTVTGETIVEVGNNYETVTLKNLIFINGIKEDANALLTLYPGTFKLIYKNATSVSGAITGSGTFTDSTFHMTVGLSHTNPITGITVNLKRKK